MQTAELFLSKGCVILFRLQMMEKRPLKILITAPSLDETRHVSGISTVVRQIIEHGKFSYEHFEAGRSDGERKSAGWIAKQFALPIEFFRAIKRGKIDVVHINTAFNSLSILRDFTLVKAAKLAKVSVVLHIHGGKFLAQEFESARLKNIAEKMLRASDEIIVLSELEKKIIEKRWQNLNVKALENAVEIVKTAEIEKVRNSILFLGRLTESKGLNEIIEAVRILKNEGLNFTFRAFGAGESEDFFEIEMTTILADRFCFGGVIAGKAKLAELAKTDIFVLPSRYGEGLPMAMLEAMAAKCVVVVSEMASIGAVVKDGENGFLVEPQNVSQLTEKLRNILSSKSDFEILREKARQTIAEKFNLRDYIERLEQIYLQSRRNFNRRS